MVSNLIDVESDIEGKPAIILGKFYFFIVDMHRSRFWIFPTFFSGAFKPAQ